MRGDQLRQMHFSVDCSPLYACCVLRSLCAGRDQVRGGGKWQGRARAGDEAQPRSHSGTKCGRGEGAYSQPVASRAAGLDRFNSFEVLANATSGRDRGKRGRVGRRAVVERPPKGRSRAVVRPSSAASPPKTPQKRHMERTSAGEKNDAGPPLPTTRIRALRVETAPATIRRTATDAAISASVFANAPCGNHTLRRPLIYAPFRVSYHNSNYLIPSSYASASYANNGHGDTDSLC